jgi:hypothetical protein
MRRNRPFVAERLGEIVGFADVQADGYIDQFFVVPEVAGQGWREPSCGRLNGKLVSLIWQG